MSRTIRKGAVADGSSSTATRSRWRSAPFAGCGTRQLAGVLPGVHVARRPSFDADDFIPTNPWPSSDWMAIVSERGFPALLLLGLVGVATALGAWARVRHAGARPPDPTD